MKIAVIVYSSTGNTAAVSERLTKKLLAAGHAAELIRIFPAGEEARNSAAVRFDTLPDTAGYQAFVFAAPVHAFSLCPVMEAFLTKLPPLDGRKAACLVTQYFPFPALGGKQAIAKMTALCEAKGGKVEGSGIVNWSKKKREKQIEAVTDGLCKLF